MADETDITVTAADKPPAPVGTLAELNEQGLDPAVYACCARPNKAAGVRGCAWFNRCKVSAKGKDGPRNYGVQIIKGRKQGGGIASTVVDCMWIADNAEKYEANGGAIKVVANEGESLVKITGVLLNSQTQKETFPRDRDAYVERRRVERKVNPWPRPGENPALLEDVLRAEVAEAEMERRSDEGLARSLGLGASIPAIDKRAERGDGDGKKASGGKP